MQNCLISKSWYMYSLLSSYPTQQGVRKRGAYSNLLREMLEFVVDSPALGCLSSNMLLFLIYNLPVTHIRWSFIRMVDSGLIRGCSYTQKHFHPTTRREKVLRSNMYQLSYPSLLQEKSQANAVIIIKQAMPYRSSSVPSCLPTSLMQLHFTVSVMSQSQEVHLSSIFPGPSQQPVATRIAVNRQRNVFVSKSAADCTVQTGWSEFI